MNLYKHTVTVPFTPGKERSWSNEQIGAWWAERQEWLEAHGLGSWHVYRLVLACTIKVNGMEPPQGNNNINEEVIYTFTDGATATLFKLTWG